MEPSTHTAADATAAGIGLIVLAVYGIIFIITFICFIKVLIALFKKEGAGLGILGLFCGIYTFIWGWIKSTELGLKKTMMVWTLCIVAAVGVWVLAVAGAIGVAASNPEFQKELNKAMEDAQKKAQEQQAQPAPAPNN